MRAWGSRIKTTLWHVHSQTGHAVTPHSQNTNLRISRRAAWLGAAGSMAESEISDKAAPLLTPVSSRPGSLASFTTVLLYDYDGCSSNDNRCALIRGRRDDARGGPSGRWCGGGPGAYPGPEVAAPGPVTLIHSAQAATARLTS